MYNSGYARHSSTIILRGAETEASAVATAAAGSGITVGTLATAVPTTLRGAEAEAFAVATAAAGSCTAVATLATAAAAAAASAAAWRLRQRALRAEGSRRGGAVSRAKNVLPIEPSILFESGPGSPEKSPVGIAALLSAEKGISVQSEFYESEVVRGFAQAVGGGKYPRAGPRACLPGPASTVPLPGAADAVGGGYASAKPVFVCGSCGLVMHWLVYKLASEPGPRPRLSAKGVCMDGNATPAVLGSARGRGMAGGLSGNARPTGLGRARNRGVACGVNGDATPAGLHTARNRGGGGVDGNATAAGLGATRNRGVAGGVNVNATPAGLGMAQNRGVAGGVNGNATQAELGMARDRGVAGGFDATEGVYGRSKLGVRTGSKSDVHVGSNI